MEQLCLRRSSPGKALALLNISLENDNARGCRQEEAFVTRQRATVVSLWLWERHLLEAANCIFQCSSSVMKPTPPPHQTTARTRADFPYFWTVIKPTDYIKSGVCRQKKGRKAELLLDLSGNPLNWVGGQTHVVNTQDTKSVLFSNK